MEFSRQEYWSRVPLPSPNRGVRRIESESEVAQSCQTLSDPRDCSPPGSSIRGIFQARVLEWVAISLWVQSLGWDDPLEKRKATPSSILAWRIPWTRKESDTIERLTLSC